MSLEKMVCGEGGNYTARVLKENVNGLIDFAPNSVEQVFLNSMSGGVSTYIVSGDSTRDNAFNEMIAYYNKQLPKVGISSVFKNAESGLKMSEWFANSRTSSLQAAINATPNTGLNTIHEFSLGINDATLTQAQLTQLILDCCNAYLTAKPDAVMILVSPVTTLTNTSLRDAAYADAASQLGLQLIVGSEATASVYDDADYYQDATHPNKFGSMRLLNYIMTAILPVEGKMLMTLDNVAFQNPPTTALIATIQNGSYSSNTGAFVADANKRALAPIDVEPNFVLRVTNKGTLNRIVFMDINGVKTGEYGRLTDVGETWKELIIPIGVYQIRINMDNDGAAYDLRGDIPTVAYAPLGSAPYLDQVFINKGLAISMPIVNTQLIDKVGSVGAIGQVVTAQGDGTWLWV